MNDNHFRAPLPAGTVLRCGDARYILEKAVSFGGSSVFYAAKKEGSALPFGVKECCPAALAGHLRRKNGVWSGVEEASEAALSQSRARLLQEASISQAVAAVSSRSIPVWEAFQEITVETPEGAGHAPEGSFLLLRRVDRLGLFLSELLAECALPPEEGHPLRVGGRPHIHTIARILEETLSAVKLVHSAGYLYGDVQPDNLFFADARPERGKIGFGCLLDFGCARPFAEDNKTAPITDRMVFSTAGFTAPEIVWDNDGTLQLTPAADVYSVGRLLLYLLKGRTYYENGQDRLLTEGASLIRLLPAEGEKLGCTGEALRRTQRLLQWSLCTDPADRYQTAAEMLEDVEKLVLLTQPPRNQLALSFSALAKGEFLGREEKLLELNRALRESRKPVVLWGFAGMGKTELAIECGRRYSRGQAYFVRFQGSVRQTVTGPIADAFSGYDRKDAAGREKPEEQIYREVMKLLGEQAESDLLILDNMDGDADGFEALRGEAAFQELCALPMGLLVTTRSEVAGGIEADALPLPLLRELMRRFVPALSDELANALIGAVESHTLTVELMARTLKYSVPRIAPEALLKKISEGDLDSKAFASVSSHKDRAGKIARIQGHLTQLFRLSALPVVERRMMAYALPVSEAGLAAADMARIPCFDQDALLRLIDRGWIRRSEDDVLTLHPLVRETGWRELEPVMEVLLNFAVGLRQRTIFDLRCSDAIIGQRFGYAHSIYRRISGLKGKTGAGLCACHLLQEQGRFQQALALADELFEALDQWPARDRTYHECEVEILQEYGDCLKKTGRAETAAFYREWADNLREELPKSAEVHPAEGTPAYYRSDGMTGAEAEGLTRMVALQELVQQGKYAEALQRYEGDRQWYLANDLDTTVLDIVPYTLWYKLGDLKKAYMALRTVCEEMSRGKRFTGIYVTLLLDLIRFDVKLNRVKEGQALMTYTIDILKQLFPDERKQVLADQGKKFVQLAWQQGWVNEAAAWVSATHEFDDAPE